MTILEVVESYGVKLKRSGSQFIGLCPFHDDTKPSFVVYPETESWFCFSENIGGSVVEFISRIENISIQEARELCQARGLSVAKPYNGVSEVYIILKRSSQIFRSFIQKHGVSEKILSLMKSFDTLPRLNESSLIFLEEELKSLEEEMSMSKIVRITKKYEKKVSKDWCSWLSGIEITREYEPNEIDSKEKLIEENKKLFNLVRALVEADLNSVEELKDAE